MTFAAIRVAAGAAMLWALVLPGTVAGLAQVSVPVISVAAGMLLLHERLTLRLLIAGAFVLTGIGVSLLTGR